MFLILNISCCRAGVSYEKGLKGENLMDIVWFIILTICSFFYWRSFRNFVKMCGSEKVSAFKLCLRAMFVFMVFPIFLAIQETMICFIPRTIFLIPLYQFIWCGLMYWLASWWRSLDQNDDHAIKFLVVLSTLMILEAFIIYGSYCYCRHL